MAEKSFVINHTAGYVMSDLAAERLLSSGDGDAALLYIFMLRAGGEAELTAAERGLGLTPERVRLAMAKLETLGLTGKGGEAAPSPEPAPEKAPERPAAPESVPAVLRYSAAETAALINGDPKLRQLADEAEKLFARVLSSSEYSRLVGLYTEVGLSPETILLAVNYCFDVNERRGKRTTMRDVERLGYKWAEMELFDVHRAEAYLERRQQLDDMTERVRAALQLGDRALSPTERRYITDWLEMGFHEDALQEAYDRTVVKTGRLTWKYMDTIVRSWHEKGLHSLEAIKAGDNRPTARPGAAGRGESTADESDIEWMRRFVGQGRKEGEG